LQLANASSPAAQAIVGASMAADIARAIDRAWLASSTPKASDGLGSLTGSGAVEIDVDGVYENVDCFSDAISEAEAVEATITAFCADASTVKALRKLKTFSGSTESNEPLLQGQARDATTGFRSRILGVPIYSLPSGTIELGTIWAYDRSRVFVVLREDILLEVDRSFFFNEFALAVRSWFRVGFGVGAHPTISSAHHRRPARRLITQARQVNRRGTHDASVSTMRKS
jgi:HK97 family phage major capsid protein